MRGEERREEERRGEERSNSSKRSSNSKRSSVKNVVIVRALEAARAREQKVLGIARDFEILPRSPRGY